MKKFLLLFGIVAMTISATAQTIIIMDEDNGWSDVGGTEVTVTGASTDLTVHPNFEVENLSASTIVFRWKRLRLAHTAGFSDQLCDLETCISCLDQDLFIRPQSFDLPAGDSSDFTPKLEPNGVSGCAIYRYYVCDASLTPYDSVDVKYVIDGQNCFLGAEEQQEELTINAYPNPAADIFTINLASTNGDNIEMKLYNVLGDEVSSQTLVEGQNTISVSSLNNGIYFYSVIRNNDVIETKKLVVRH